MWPFTSKPKVDERRTVSDAVVEVLLNRTLKEGRKSTFTLFKTKGVMRVTTMEDVEQASSKAYKPWKESTWECEQQAIELMQQVQKTAAATGISKAVGVIRAEAPFGAKGLHVYVFAVIESKGGFMDVTVLFFDATNRRWVPAKEINNADFALI